MISPIIKINEELKNLYKKYWGELYSVYNGNASLETESADPLLISIADEEEFSKADFRLMVFGQETNGWGTENGGYDVEIICNKYDRFFNKREKGLKGQFWNGVSKFLKLLKVKFPSKRIFPTWNNIIKIGKSEGKGRPPNYIYNIERDRFSVIKEELSIMNPNIVLFFTGPNYDDVINDNFGSLKYEAVTPFSERQLSRLSLNNIPFVFRTYHPNYLWRHNIEEYFTAIIKNIEL